MIRAKMSNLKPGLGLFACLTAVAFLLAAAPAGAAIGPKWRIDADAPTAVQPGETIHYEAGIRNVGDQPTTGTAVVKIMLPPGITGIAGSGVHFPFSFPECKAANGTDPVFEATAVRCEFPEGFTAQNNAYVSLEAKVDLLAQPGAILTAEFEVESEGTSPASTVDPTRIGPLPPFGIDAFDSQVTDAAGNPSTQAGAHPDQISTYFDYNDRFNPNPLINGVYPIEATRDVLVDTPPGLLGSAAAAPRCKLSELANSDGLDARPLCLSASQLGMIQVRIGYPETDFLTFPLFNVDPPPGTPARFGFNIFGVIVVLDAEIRSDGDYGLTVASRQISEGLGVVGITTNFWGDPADQSHDPERACSGEPAPSLGGKTCAASATQIPFLRNPTACTATPSEGLPWAVHIDSWDHPGAQSADGAPDLSDPAWKSASIDSHNVPGYPHLPSEWGQEAGITGCGKVPFTPSFSATPSTNSADSPSGLDVNLSVPQECWSHVDQICQSDLKDAAVKLPAGMGLNPSAVTGLEACAPEQVGLTTPVGQSSPIHFDKDPAGCPDSSKIGTVSIETPLLGRFDKDGNPVLDENGTPVPDPLTGAVYLAQQSNNPFNSLLAMYLVAEGSGVVVKQAGEIRIEPNGQLVTVFREAPQQPFTNLNVSLFGGPRAVLRTPPNCGEYATKAKLTPWSGNAAATPSSFFEITNCPNNGFDPKLTAGTANPVAASFSPFNLRITREDGNQELSSLVATLPPGLLGSLEGIPYCPEAALNTDEALGAGAAWLAAPGCPAAAQLGTVTVGAGAGPTPFFTELGRAYLAGPYKGAPLSLAVVAPAIAGPFDLGNVVVRNALQVDPESTRITAVSDPIPTQLNGIGLDLRDVRVQLDRPDFILNPTSCDEMQIDATLGGAGGAIAQRSQRFQVAGCDRLGFKPKLALRLKGKTRRAGNPALRATLTMPPNGANIAKAQVSLPHSEFLDQSHIRTICTRVQFAARECPAGSVYGHATAFSPLLGQPLSGPVYLRSSDNPLPDLVAALEGQIHVDLVGRIDTHNEGIRTTFEGVPDAPVSKFVLQMQGGRKGLLQNSTNICRGKHRATALFDGQNGKTRDFAPMLVPKCGGVAAGHSHHPAAR
jgi:uncharacterized repeat protein (TIGR01451 family)